MKDCEKAPGKRVVFVDTTSNEPNNDTYSKGYHFPRCLRAPQGLTHIRLLGPCMKTTLFAPLMGDWRAI
jgi:hypothetical protein